MIVEAEESFGGDKQSKGDWIKDNFVAEWVEVFAGFSGLIEFAGQKTIDAICSLDEDEVDGANLPAPLMEGLCHEDIGNNEGQCKSSERNPIGDANSAMVVGEPAGVLSVEGQNYETDIYKDDDKHRNDSDDHEDGSLG